MKRVRLFLSLMAITALLEAAFTGCVKTPGETNDQKTGSVSAGSGDRTAAGTETEPASETEAETLPPEPEYELKLSDTYKPNGITFSTFEVTVGDLTVRCPSIHGLSDETVSRRINVGLFQHVSEEAGNLSALYPEGITAMTSNSVLDASFSNVISVRTTFIVEEAPGSADGERPLVVEFSDNYELLTGRPFSFREVFRDGLTAADLFGESGERTGTVKIKDFRTLEIGAESLTGFSDLSEVFAPLSEAFDRMEEIPFRFDEKEAVAIQRAGNAIVEISVPYLDHLYETVLYDRFQTGEPIYEKEPEESYPVLFKRFPSKHAVFENSGQAFIDAVFYAPDEAEDGLMHYVTEDAIARMEERIRSVKEASDGLLLYNAELSLYEMKSGYRNGKPAPVYVSIREYVRQAATEEEFEALKNEALNGLQTMSEEEAVLKKTLILDGEAFGAERRFAAWYYDEAGGFIEESALEAVQ